MYTIANYLLDRLDEIGVKHIFGVPGDYNLELLDYVVSHPEIEWYGNMNELNAAYAADGYARINGVSALITTYGVGELSAINGIAGSFAEDIPVIKIVGVPKKELMLNDEIIHHSLGNCKFDAFKKAYENVTSYQIWLDNKNACSQIDEAIKQAIFNKKPVYIMVPADIIHLPSEPIKNSLSFGVTLNKDNMSTVISDLQEKIKNAKKAVIIAGNKINSYGLKQALEDFVDKANINVVVNPFGKGCFNEQNKNFLGIYIGKNTVNTNVKEFVDSADLIITIGSRFTDLASSDFHLGYKKDKIFNISANFVEYDNKTYTQVSMGAILKIMSNNDIEYSGERIDNPNLDVSPFFAENNKITQTRLLECINSFIKKDDIIVSDIGSYLFGMQYLNLKENNDYIFQPLWASIGFSFPASIGAKVADQNRRVIHVIGDGAFDMTFNELASAVNNGVNTIMFVLNNKGYTIEKLIHGPNQSYNELPFVDYSKLLQVFDKDNNKHISFKITNEIELYECMNKINSITDKFVLVEVMLEPMDLPEQFKSIN